MPDSRSTAAAAIMPPTSASILAMTSSRVFSFAMALLQGCGGSERERAFGVRTRTTREREVGAGLVEHEIDEDAGLRLHRADDVVLLAERDEDVLDAVVEAEALHRLHLRAHDLGVAGRGQLEIHTGA